MSVCVKCGKLGMTWSIHERCLNEERKKGTLHELELLSKEKLVVDADLLHYIGCKRKVLRVKK